MQDPFVDVKNLSVEISQATYTELISVTLAEDKAISSRTSIRNSIPKLAFNRKNVESNSSVSADSNTGTTTFYNYSEASTAIPLRAQNIGQEFRGIVKNSITEGNSYCDINNNIPSCVGSNAACPIDIAFLIDNSASMQAKFDQIKQGLSRIIEHLKTVSTDFRLSLMTFADCEEFDYKLKFGCSNDGKLIENISNITFVNGLGGAEASNEAIAAVQGSSFGGAEIALGSWRGAGVNKLMFLITDAVPGGCTQQYTPDIDQFLRVRAESAKDCGIRYYITYFGDGGSTTSPTDLPIYREIAQTTSGSYQAYRWVDSENVSAVMLSSFVAFLASICPPSDPDTPESECSESNNLLKNGEFNQGLDYWQSLGTTWSEAELAARIQGQPAFDDPSGPKIAGYLEQYFVSGVEPGTLITLGFNVKGPVGSKITYYLSAEANSVSGEYTLEKEFVYARIIISTIAPSVSLPPPNGPSVDIGVLFQTLDDVYVDKVYICETPNADCPGGVNAISNPDFKLGVEGWENDDGPLLPVDDPLYWEETSQSAVLSPDGTLKFKQTITAPGNSKLVFYILGNDPDDIPDYGINYKIYKDGETYVDENVYNKDITEYPHRVEANLSNTADIQGATLEFSIGPGATPEGFIGTTLLRGISLCKATTQNCPADTLDFSDFTSSRNGWAGGTHNKDQGRIDLLVNESITKTYNNLVVGSEVTISYLMFSPQVSGSLCTLISGDNVVSGDYTGPKKIIIGATGSLTVKIESNKTNPDQKSYSIDGILLCTKFDSCLTVNRNTSPPYLDPGSVRGLSLGIKWNTVPRNPVHIVSAFVRYDMRDYNDPSLTSVAYSYFSNLRVKGAGSANEELIGCGIQKCLDFSSKFDSRVIPCGLSSSVVPECDKWKQQGWFQAPPVPGDPIVSVYDLSVLETMLRLLVLKSESDENLDSKLSKIEAGSTITLFDQSWGGTQRLNYLWSIPINKDASLLSEYRVRALPKVKIVSGNGPFGLETTQIDVKSNIAKITVYLLSNQILPDGPTTYACGPIDDYNCISGDDSLTLSISYMNTRGQSKKFDQKIERNNIFIDQLSPDRSYNQWNNNTSMGDGILEEGPFYFNAARWDKFEFDIDNIYGTGLDQCSKPQPTKNFVGDGILTFKNFELTGGASYYPLCDAEVTVEAVSDGVTLNETQSIVLPNPTGGTWTLKSTIKGVSQTVTLSGKATASQIQSALESMTNIGSGNVVVTGDGADSSPFIIEFVGSLSGLDITELIANGQNLLGSGSGLVQTIENGGTNERQQIYMSNGNMVDLTIQFNGSTSAAIPYNASINDKQAALEALSSIGSGNILVTGETSSRDVPYTGTLTVDFIGSLGGTNVPSMVASPEPNYSVITVYNGGGNNEKQLVTVTASGGSFRLKIYNPQLSGLLKLSLTPNSTPTLSAYTRVSGTPLNDDVPGTEISGRPGYYEFNVSNWPDGDFVVDIDNPVGRFCLRKVNTNYYTGTTWDEVEDSYRRGGDSSGNNGIGLPSGLDEHYWTTSLNYNAAAAEVKAALADAPFLELSDISVDKLVVDPGVNQWRIEFTGSKANQNVRQMEIDTSALLGGNIKVSTIQNGSSTAEVQRIKIFRAVAGSFRLSIKVDGIIGFTDGIIWNTDAEGLRQDIAAHPKIALSQVQVVKEVSSDPEIVGQFLVTLTGLGNVDLMRAIFGETLLCNPINLDAVPEPPYNYPVTPACELPPRQPCSINECSPGPGLIRPCDGESPLPLEPCCDPIRESANKALYYKYQRDLFDPNIKASNGARRTIRELARSKGLNTKKYTPYIRNFANNTLTVTTYDRIIDNGMSIVLIDAQIDTSGGKYQILKQLRSNEILPKRQIWPDGILPGVNSI